MNSKNFQPLSITLGLSALVIFLVGQVILSFEVRGALQRTLQGSTPLVGQSQQIQGNASKLLSDLIDLSERNANAKAVIQKYGIQRAGQGTSPPAAPAAK